MNFSDKIFAISTQEEFSQLALEVFRFQAQRCAPYRQYVELLGVDPTCVSRVEDIPFLPIELFKLRDVYCGNAEPEKVFTSSSTTGQTPSRHMMQSLALYEQAFTRAFEQFYGNAEGWSIYGLLPNYLQREGSSLVYMVDRLIARCGSGGFYLDEYEKLLSDMAADPKPKILLGVSYALWDLAEQYAPKLENTVVMETGGMKGRREELPKAEFHKILTSAFGVEKIHSEYGMAELTSQAYSSGDGVFNAPQWMRVLARDVNNPLKVLPQGSRGALNIIDLANLSSCAFIATQDVGRTYEDGAFMVEGRLSGAEVRGCNLLVQ
ncbi:MAG: acyltransferase [Alistipes sp.]|nr:acyltransferase [Alistipes sp.]MBQ5922130.1 acyltransferase [Alistipes sp.]